MIPMRTLIGYEGDTPLPPNIKRYALRLVDMSIGSVGGHLKFGPAAMVGLIQPWKGTRVGVGSGRVGGRMELPVDFVDYYITCAAKFRRPTVRRRESQTQKIARELLPTWTEASPLGPFEPSRRT